MYGLDYASSVVEIFSVSNLLLFSFFLSLFLLFLSLPSFFSLSYINLNGDKELFLSSRSRGNFLFQKRPSISPVSASTSTLRYPGAVGRPGMVWISAASAYL